MKIRKECKFSKKKREKNGVTSKKRKSIWEKNSDINKEGKLI